jgi:hypothetical protein
MRASVIDIECVVITTLAVAYALLLLLRRLQRSRPELSVTTPLAVGFTLRLLVIAGVAATGLGHTLRGPDESTWLSAAHQLAALPFSSGQWLPTSHQSFLHVIVMAAQMKVLGSPVGALRITMIGIAMAGMILIVAAVYDMAGPRAALLTAWLLCLEPAGLLFDSNLLKEPPLELASGMFVLGASKAWSRLDLKGIALMGLGGVIALGAREYIGWFMFACEVLVIFHASLRNIGRQQLRAIPLIYGVAAVALVGIPAILNATSNQSLQQNLQPIQAAESVTGVSSTQASGSHLALGAVNFSTRSAVLSNLPQRISDVLLHPYPWQAQDISQLLGALGSLVALAGFLLLLRYAFLIRGQVLRRAGPLLYPFVFLTIAYALATGNAGQGFRYRTHLVTLALAALVVLRVAVLQRRGRESASVQRVHFDPGARPPGPREIPAH